VSRGDYFYLLDQSNEERNDRKWKTLEISLMI
jgi:hypothetical protein